MSSTELVTHGQASTTLTIDPEQSEFTEQQVSVLRHIGVENASAGDLAVFFHVVKRTGLDPFARQIYMIGRQASENVNGQWVKTTKQTIQTGIDGFRLIGRRAADAARVPISLSAPEWAHTDGTWRPVWVAGWGTPVAARVTIFRDGNAFPAVALFDEYKQMKRDGALTSMWATRPAGQIAKCAEALAWRMAFPQDLASVYSEDEMGQADTHAEPAPPAPREGAARMRAALAPVAPDPVADPVEDVQDAEVVDDPPTDLITAAQSRAMHAALTSAGLADRATGLAYIAEIIGRVVETSKELTRGEASAVIDALKGEAAGDGGAA